jgi:hypothetical protein
MSTSTDAVRLLLIAVTTNLRDLTGKKQVALCVGLLGELCMLPDIYEIVVVAMAVSIIAIWLSDDWRE